MGEKERSSHDLSLAPKLSRKDESEVKTTKSSTFLKRSDGPCDLGSQTL